jgi:hypothetical protein
LNVAAALLLGLALPVLWLTLSRSYLERRAAAARAELHVWARARDE